MIVRPGPRTFTGLLFIAAWSAATAAGPAPGPRPDARDEALASASSVPSPGPAALDAAAAARPPLAFEPMPGPDGESRYRAYGPGYVVDVLPGEVRVATARPAADVGPRAAGSHATRARRDTPSFDLSRMVLAGARPATLRGVGPLPSVSNSFVGPDPSQWRAGVPHSGRVVAAGVYEGVDLVYYGNDGRLQYDFLVAPGADPSAIALAFPEAASLRLDEDGHLLVAREGAAALVTRAPVLFQDIDGERRPVDGRFVLDAAAREVRIEVGAYDPTHALVIDPVLEYGTYFGAIAAGVEPTVQPASLGVDRYGSMYIAGTTTGALPLPTPPGGNTGAPVGPDVFLAKFNAAGQLVYTTRYGGSLADQASDIAVSPGGEVALVGRTSSPGLPGSTGPGVHDATLDGTIDGFVARFSAAGAPVWASYLGGSGGGTMQQFEFESLDRILLEPTGHLLVAGSVLDIGTLNGVDPTFNSNPQFPFEAPDGFVGRFSASGGLVDATYLGSIEYDQILALARGPGGAVIVAGYTASTFRTGYGVTSPAYQPTCDAIEGEDGGCPFVARLAADLRSVPAATFFGPAYEVTPSSLAVDADGSIVLAGSMFAGATPTGGAIAATAGAFDTTFNGASDAFVARLPATLASLDVLTYFGGSADDYPQSVRIDAAGQIHVSGSTDSPNFPVQAGGALKATYDGSPDAFLVRFFASLDQFSATFLSRVGGVDDDSGAVITLGAGGTVYLLGMSGPLPTATETGPRATIPVTGNRFQAQRAPGATAAYLYRLGPDANGPEITSISPSGSGVPAAGSAVTIVGSGFGVSAEVRIGGLPATVTSRDATSVAVLMPAGTVGSPDVAVTNQDGGSAIVTDPFNRVSFTRRRVGSQVQGEAGVSTGNIVQPSLSRDGRWLAFHTGTDRMVLGDTNGVADVFVRDRAADVFSRGIVRVSVGADGQQANGASTRAKISANGRFVAFVSAASNLVPGDTNGVEDVFVHDRDADGNGEYDETFPGARATFRVSVASTGAQANGASGQPDLSPDGLWVAFVSTATNLVPGDTNGVRDVFLHHWPGSLTARVSVGTGNVQGNGPSDSPGVSAGGRRVVFASDATNLVANDGNGVRDVFLFDRTDRTTTRLSTRDGTTGDANGPSDSPSIDDRGGTIAFQTRATNILPALAGQSVPRWQVVTLRLPTVTPLDAVRLGLGLSRLGEPVVNVADAIRNLISGNASGQPSQGDSQNPSVNGDGTGVAFQSDGSDLVLGDTNGEQDVFVAPAEGGEPERVSVAEDGSEGGEPSQQGVISDDGSTVAFQSLAPLTPDVESQQQDLKDDNLPILNNVFVRGTALVLTSVAPQSGSQAGGETVTITGANFNGVSVRFGGVSAQVQTQTDSTVVVKVPAALRAGPVNVSVTSATGETQTAVNGFTYLATGGDADVDGLTDAWEQQYGLNPASAAGTDGGTGDPDGDGLTNAEEEARGSHPRGAFQRFLAEGATIDIGFTNFTTRIALANPSITQTATVLLRFQRAEGTEVPTLVTLPPLQSRQVVVNDVAGMAGAEFATLVESDVEVIVDRQMWWNGQEAYGTHAEGAVKAPSLEWYLAEGATHSTFDLFYLLQNPSSTPATVKVRYLRPSGLPPLEKTYTVAANSRKSIWVDFEKFPDDTGTELLNNTDVSAVVEVQNNVPIIVERAMYLSRGAERFSAGHESAGVTAPSTTWFLAEGATGQLFDLFVLLANPSDTDAVAKVTYLLDDGRVFTQDNVKVGKNSRQTLWVDFQTPDDGPAGVLNGPALSTKVEVTNGVPIIVERAMWWPGGPSQWYEAHNSPGSTVTGTVWGLGDGALSGPPLNVQTYILLANTDPAATANVRVTLLYQDGPGTPRVFPVSPSSRFTINVAVEFPEARGRSFGALIESLDGSGGVPVPIVVERALYNDARGLFLAGGSNQLATRLK